MKTKTNWLSRSTHRRTIRRSKRQSIFTLPLRANVTLTAELSVSRWAVWSVKQFVLSGFVYVLFFIFMFFWPTRSDGVVCSVRVYDLARFAFFFFNLRTTTLKKNVFRGWMKTVFYGGFSPEVESSPNRRGRWSKASSMMRAASPRTAALLEYGDRG